jgi:hypothetical protein
MVQMHRWGSLDRERYTNNMSQNSQLSSANTSIKPSSGASKTASSIQSAFNRFSMKYTIGFELIDGTFDMKRLESTASDAELEKFVEEHVPDANDRQKVVDDLRASKAKFDKDQEDLARAVAMVKAKGQGSPGA